MNSHCCPIGYVHSFLLTWYILPQTSVNDNVEISSSYKEKTLLLCSSQCLAVVLNLKLCSGESMPTVRCCGPAVHMFLTLKWKKWYTHRCSIYHHQATVTDCVRLWLVLKRSITKLLFLLLLLNAMLHLLYYGITSHWKG